MFAHELHVGKIGEHICALRMLKSGISASIINLDTVDIVAQDRNRMWRIQVKSGSLRQESDRMAGYQFNIAVGGKKKRPLTHLDCDIVALVAIEQEQVFFCPVSSLMKQKTKRMTAKRFEEQNLCLRTWSKTLDYFD